MKERPILFSAPMVRAILEGRKTQTRRAFKDKANWHFLEGRGDLSICPYGQPGDRLWVREAFGYEVRSLGGTPHEKITYRASNPDAVHCYDCNGMELPMKWKPSIHMQRWASRITLEIVSVRVERLNEISEHDAIAEGIIGPHHLSSEWSCGDSKWFSSPVKAFSNLWESINGAGSWQQNPWVWVVEFKRVKP